MRHLLSVVCLGCIVASLSAADTPRLTSEERRAVRELTDRLEDPTADALAIVAEIEGFGPAAERYLLRAVRDRLVDDGRGLPRAIRAAGDLDGLERFLTERDELRAAARENLKQLAKGEPIKRAKQYHEQLVAMQAKLDALYRYRLLVARILIRREPLMAKYTALADDVDRRFAPEDERQLRTEGEAFLGMDLATVRATMAVAAEPEDAAAARLWTYLRARRIEEWNRSNRELMSRGEWDNLVAVNAYREALGIRPYEIDHRLLQSARQHSKEMHDKGYFSHSSPTPGRRGHTQRMKLAGYKGGYSENICNGAQSGEMAFWMWFSSPPHHKNMVNPGNTQLGVGQWGSLWTQNMGRAKPLLPLTQEERVERTTPACEILEPCDRQE